MSILRGTFVALAAPVTWQPGAAQPPGRPLFPHDARRSGRGDGGLPLLQPRWQYSTIHDELYDPTKKVEDPVTEKVIQDALAQAEKAKQPVLPGFYPIVAGDR